MADERPTGELRPLHQSEHGDERAAPDHADVGVREELLARELERIPVVGGAGRHAGDWTWVILTLVGLTAFSLDLAGGKGSGLHRLEDALHLFSSGFPGRPAKGTSPLAEIAQQLAPLVVLFLSLKLVTTVFRKQLTRLRARG